MSKMKTGNYFATHYWWDEDDNEYVLCATWYYEASYPDVAHYMRMAQLLNESFWHLSSFHPLMDWKDKNGVDASEIRSVRCIAVERGRWRTCSTMWTLCRRERCVNVFMPRSNSTRVEGNMSAPRLAFIFKTTHCCVMGIGLRGDRLGKQCVVRGPDLCRAIRHWRMRGRVRDCLRTRGL
jgi:hypothetical protein